MPTVPTVATTTVQQASTATATTVAASMAHPAVVLAITVAADILVVATMAVVDTPVVDTLAGAASMVAADIPVVVVVTPDMAADILAKSPAQHTQTTEPSGSVVLSMPPVLPSAISPR